MHSAIFHRLMLSLALITPAAGGVSAQPVEGGARAGALGGAATALLGDVWSHANPAGRGALDRRAVAFFASQGFGMAELRLGAAIVAVPTRLGVVAAGARTFGFEDFRESRFTAGFARGFQVGGTRRIYAGLDLTWHTVQVAGYGSSGALGVTAGWAAELFPGFQAGFAARNVNAPRFAPGEPLDRNISLGLSYTTDDRLRILVDAQKDVRRPLSVRAGAEVEPAPFLAFRAGVGTEPVRFAAGIGVQAGPLRADVAADRHEVLGWTPAVSVEVGW